MNTRLRKQRALPAAETLEVRAMLTVITVTSFEDNLDVDGDVTFREAILAANENRSVDGSAVGEQSTD